MNLNLVSSRQINIIVSIVFESNSNLSGSCVDLSKYKELDLLKIYGGIQSLGLCRSLIVECPFPVVHVFALPITIFIGPVEALTNGHFEQCFCLGVIKVSIFQVRSLTCDDVVWVKIIGFYFLFVLLG